ncbi:MAG: hypothetical protein SOX84_03975 [Prevotella sp.]|nr:hypothetical protein [Prevotella sp.]
MDTSSRIKAILDFYNLSVNQFVNMTKIKTKQAVYDLLSGKTKSISPAMQNKILSCFVEINKAWLLTGEGSMLQSSLPSSEPRIVATDEFGRLKEENDVRRRISAIFNEIGETQNKLAGGDPATQKRLNRQLGNSEAAITVDTLLLILNKHSNVSAEWLLRGKGDMFLDEKDTILYNSGINGDNNANNTVNDSDMLSRLVGLVEAKDKQIAHLLKIIESK